MLAESASRPGLVQASGLLPQLAVRLFCLAPMTSATN